MKKISLLIGLAILAFLASTAGLSQSSNAQSEVAGTATPMAEYRLEHPSLEWDKECDETTGLYYFPGSVRNSSTRPGDTMTITAFSVTGPNGVLNTIDLDMIDKILGPNETHYFTVREVYGIGKYTLSVSGLFSHSGETESRERSVTTSGNCHKDYMTPSPTVVNTSTPTPTETQSPTHTATPTVTQTPSHTPTGTITLEPTPTETQVTPTATDVTSTPVVTITATAQPTDPAVTATPDYPDSFYGCRIGIGSYDQLGHYAGLEARWFILRADGSRESYPVLVNQVKHEPGMADLPLFLEMTFANMIGQDYAVDIYDDNGVYLGTIIVTKSCERESAPLATSTPACTNCPPEKCEALYGADVMEIENTHPITGEKIYRIISKIELPGSIQYTTATGDALWTIPSLSQSMAAEYIAAGHRVVRYQGTCSTCVIGWGVRRLTDDSLEVFWGYGSTVWDTARAIADAFGLTVEEYHLHYTDLMASANQISVEWNARLDGQDSGWYPISDPRQ